MGALKSVPNADGELPALALASFPVLPKPGAGGFVLEMKPLLLLTPWRAVRISRIFTFFCHDAAKLFSELKTAL